MLRTYCVRMYWYNNLNPRKQNIFESYNESFEEMAGIPKIELNLVEGIC